MCKKYIICIPYLFKITAENNYKNIIKNIDYDNYQLKINEFKAIENDSTEYLYYYSILLKNVIFLNILADNVFDYVFEVKRVLSEILSRNIKKYKILAVNEILDLYNFFLIRGCEYIKIKKYGDALQSFNTAKSLYKTHEISIKIGFVNQLLENIDEAITIYEEERIEIEKENNNKKKRLSNKKKKENLKYLETININLLNIILAKNDTEEVLKRISVELNKDPKNIQYLHILNRLKTEYKIDIDKYLSIKDDILLFQKGILDFLNKEYEEAYEKLSLIKLKDIEHLKVYSDIIYNYSLKLQSLLLDKNNKDNQKYETKDLYKNLISENITTCKKILKLDSKDMKTVKRLCVLYLANRDNKLAEDLILERKIKLDELNMKDLL